MLPRIIATGRAVAVRLPRWSAHVGRNVIGPQGDVRAHRGRNVGVSGQPLDHGGHFPLAHRVQNARRKSWAPAYILTGVRNTESTFRIASKNHRRRCV